MPCEPTDTVFAAARSAALTISGTANTPVQITFDTQFVGKCFELNGWDFRCVVPGLYRITYGLTVNLPGTSDVQIAATLNASAILQSITHVTTNAGNVDQRYVEKSFLAVLSTNSLLGLWFSSPVVGSTAALTVPFFHVPVFTGDTGYSASFRAIRVGSVQNILNPV